MITPFHKRSSFGLCKKAALAFACAYGVSMAAANAQVTTVFYILLENRCFTSGTDTSQSNILFNNKNGGSPYITALCTPNSNAYTFNYQGQTISQTAQSSFCSSYHEAFATYNNTNVSPYLVGTEAANQPNGTSVHPSEPQYVFMEAGSNLSKLDDNDPYFSGGSVQQIANFLTANPSFSGENLSALLQNAGISWTSYSEGTCLLNTLGQDFNLHGGTLTNNVAPLGVRTVPLVSFGASSTSYVNAYNGTHQYNFACKHTGQLFFPATNGSGTASTSANQTTTNSSVAHYEALESLQADLAANAQAAYCVITPDQFNDGHTALSSTFTYNNYGGTNSGVTQTYASGSDLARVGQMDSFCAEIVPTILASPVYQAGHAAIVIWTDETEGSNTTVNDFYHTLTEIVISPYAKGNAYNSTLNYTHSSDVATMQEIFGVTANTASGYLNDAANLSTATPSGVTVTTNSGQGLTASTGQPFIGFGGGTTSGVSNGGGQAQDLSDLFTAGTIPAGIPTVTITASGYTVNARLHTVTQTVTLTNPLSGAIGNPVYLVLGNLSANTSLSSETPTATTGTTTHVATGSPYIEVAPSGLAAGASVTYTLKFAYPASGTITDTLSVYSAGGQP